MSFIFKFLQVIHIIACQVTVDIFFIDWERPKNQASAGGDSQKGQEASVSIWRTYFLANEWNELQVTRKINPIFQIFCVIFFLHVVGFENWTTTDPHTTLSHSRDEYVAKTNQIFRYAIGALVYLLVGKHNYCCHYTVITFSTPTGILYFQCCYKTYFLIHSYMSVAFLHIVL